MAYGGGTWLTQNKELSGAYINFISVPKALGGVSDRGVGALPMVLDWGQDNEVFEVTSEMFQAESSKYFGYSYTDDKMRGLRDFFKYAKSGYFYRLNSDGKKASNEIATALYKGTRGNDLSITIEASVDDDSYLVITYLDGEEVDKQQVTSVDKLKTNDYVTFKNKPLEETVGAKLNGGENGKEVTGGDHQKALNKLEQYHFNTLGCLANDEVTKGLYIEYTKRQRNEVGKKFQTVVYNPTQPADFEGVIALGDKAYIDAERTEEQKKADEVCGVYWVTGVSAGCPINESNENRTYNGEYKFIVNETQNKLIKAQKQGLFCFHLVDNLYKVSKDINSYTSFTVKMNKDFRLNQVIRVLDQIGYDVARTFNRYYLGKTPNDSIGRTAFYNELNDYAKELVNIRAIQEYNYKEDLKVTAGKEKEGVLVNLEVQPTVAMSKLYMTVAVK